MQDFRWTCFALMERLRLSWRAAGNRFTARIAPLSQSAKAFVSQPEPRSYGSRAKGLQLEAGNFQFAGHHVEAPDQSIWSIDPPSPGFEAELQGFGWLDDLAATGAAHGRVAAQTWLNDWIDLYGQGKGAGWTPDLTGRRVIRWINHAILLLYRQERAAHKAYFRSLGRQASFLKRRWKTAAPGLPRFEALTGLIYAGLALEGRRDLLLPAIRALGHECATQIDATGGIASRNPEELMEIFTLLTWASNAIGDADLVPQRDHLLALERIAPTLRALRLGNGDLIGFHGGGTGLPGQLDQALSDAGIRLPARAGGAMGYCRMVTGRTIVIIDAGPLPPKEVSRKAHASSLAFEMSSGHYPILVNCGPGEAFDPKWAAACRATQSHNTLGILGASSAQFAPGGFVGRTYGDRLIQVPKQIAGKLGDYEVGPSVIASHDGYVRKFGLTHARQILVVRDGGELRGEDRLGALSAADRKKYRQNSIGEHKKSIAYALHFHIHPDVEPKVDMGGTAVSLTVGNGEIWVFRCVGGKIRLRPSAYMEQGRRKPRATKQIVVSGRAVNYEGHITWTLTRVDAGPRGKRDPIMRD